ncbi:hypothetical protein [Mycobacteroides abscessus]|uniref:hypothetical protein n=1 Tax=Mycobacteroides abscessus TaxID=36809 RepID=UPI0009A60896|nr:hypothetical protein [Mycobacteroides abscessus]RIT40449.1 hypothetical protein D2E80_24385 [Mycobacteroides abscessus]SKT91461.1 Uncharacterised protein [Mycobacteroides abscessus subsp. massiliense]SKU10397.1 Uncharacterised protein [Mycobacteroides abscessus subsp. massiliense]
MESEHRSSRRRSRANAFGARRINQHDNQTKPTPGDDNTLLEIEKVRAVASYAALYALSDLIPDRPPNTPGRPAHYPAWVSVIHKVLHGAFGSANHASRIMANSDYWRILRSQAAKHGKTARAKPPRRHHHVYAQGRVDAHIDALHQGLLDTAAALARQLDCLSPHTPVSRTAPERGQFITCDGTVVASPERKSTIEKKAADGKATVSAHLEVQNGDGSKEFRYGSKFAIMSTRPDATRNLRVVLDTAPVPPGKGYKGEAGIALTMIDRLTARPELRVDGICYDGAFRGTHVDHVMKLGMIALVPPHSGTAVPTPFGTIECRCGDHHVIWTDKGRLHERVIIDTGENHLQPLPTAKVYARRTPKGTYRWYIYFATTCGTLHTERLDITPEDRKKGYNRTEHLRQFTKTDDGDSLYDRCYGWREDSESLNNTLDRTLYGGRITAHSATRQHGVMIGFALGRNAIAHYLYQRNQKTAAA